jgi:biotin transport system substrate-specific component
MEKILTRPIILDQRLSAVVGVSLFTALTALGAFVRVPLPFTPVPLTLQVFFVLLSAMVLGQKAVLSQALYIILGLAGLPVFAGAAGGFAHLSGPTGGYILGFAAAAWTINRLKGTGALRNTLALLAGIAVIYLLGSVQLGLWLRLSPVKTIQLGVMPFILGDLLKLAAVLVTVRLLKR